MTPSPRPRQVQVHRFTLSQRQDFNEPLKTQTSRVLRTEKRLFPKTLRARIQPKRARRRAGAGSSRPGRSTPSSCFNRLRVCAVDACALACGYCTGHLDPLHVGRRDVLLEGRARRGLRQDADDGHLLWLMHVAGDTRPRRFSTATAAAPAAMKRRTRIGLFVDAMAGAAVFLRRCGACVQVRRGACVGESWRALDRAPQCSCRDGPKGSEGCETGRNCTNCSSSSATYA